MKEHTFCNTQQSVSGFDGGILYKNFSLVCKEALQTLGRAGKGETSIN